MTAKTRVNIDASVLKVERGEDPDVASVQVQWTRSGGRSRSAMLQLERGSGGWALSVPAKVIEGYRALVTGATSIEIAAAP